MAHHLEQIQLVVKQPQEQLLQDFLECADGVRIIGPQIWDVREKTLLDSEDNATVFRRVYIKVHDSEDLKKVGWIMDDCSEQCFLCASHFSSVAWKHHCRRCGLTVCAPCSPHRVLLKGFENEGVQRVCKNCSPGVSAPCQRRCLCSLIGSLFLPGRAGGPVGRQHELGRVSAGSSEKPGSCCYV